MSTVNDGLTQAGTMGEPACLVVVRLTTTWWSDRRGLHSKKSLSYLRKKSTGFNLLEEDISFFGEDEVMKRIENLHESKDGIYFVRMCNEFRDWETGYLEDWDYILCPFTEPKPAA